MGVAKTAATIRDSEGLWKSPSVSLRSSHGLKDPTAGTGGEREAALLRASTPSYTSAGLAADEDTP